MNNISPYNNNSIPDVFYLKFLQKFVFSPPLSLKEPDGSIAHNHSNEKMVIPMQSYDKLFTPTYQLIHLMFNKDADEPKFPMTSPCLAQANMIQKITPAVDMMKGKEKINDERKKTINRKWPISGDKVKLEPVKRPRVIKKYPMKSASSADTCMAKVSIGQPCPSP